MWKNWRVVVSFFAASFLLMVGGFIRHPGWCADCFEPHGFPFTYRQDGGFAGGAAFYPTWFLSDLLVLALLTACIAWTWNQIRK
jgi:hypothetical protein